MGTASGRPAKRLKSGRSNATETEGPADEEGDGRVIKAHALILASRSAYFDKAMGGDWRESQDRSFEVEVADEQEYAAFRRLVKLCYGTTFTKEGGRDLDVSELVRLIHVANAFECLDAVKQCTMALQDLDLEWGGAVQCLELTDMLKDVEGMDGLAKKAGDVIAKEVGLVDEFFTPVTDEKDDGGDVLGGLRLSAKVKDLSPTVFEALLYSPGLKLRTENEAFWLLLAWVEAQSKESEEGKQALFTRMAKHLRFHAMDPGYVLLLVTEYPRIISAGLQGRVFRESLGYATLARRTAAQLEACYGIVGKTMSSLRAPLGKVSWTKNVTFTASDIAAVTSKSSPSIKALGLVAGIPWRLWLGRREGKAMVSTGACIFHYTAPDCDMGAGIFFDCHLKACSARPHKSIGRTEDMRLWTNGHLWGYKVEAWEEVFREGSEWLRDGELDVEVTITTFSDQPTAPPSETG